ncbi:hypothetical protein WISP_123095 [Willisornis vidua]|uniref:EF-hand domain-containing protein n=1 Tax=Willisornis vidua TaxID=1566151 RepID=A0ABQ9CWY3_9PASS|nr:hypothetical protein WISP_123095 [Willisornis vidua]
MAKFVVAGKANCPHYAKAEHLADYLQENLPSFRVRKITRHPDKWERYYGITSMMLSEEMLDIAEENLQTHLEIAKEDEEIKSLIKPMQIWITSASGPICYQLIPLLANGEVFGMTTEISIHLLDTDQFKEVLCGVVMEAEDMAFPLLRSISEHSDTDEAFIEADLVIVLDDVPLNLEVQSLENYIREVSEICQVYAPLIEKNAKSEVRVISSGKTFANLKATLIMTYGPSIKPENIIAISTSSESAAKAMLARKLNMSTAGQFCIPEGVIFSMPVRFQNGNWEVIKELEIDGTTQEVLERLAHELIQVKFDPLQNDYMLVCCPKVDLFDVSLIQHILSSEQSQREEQVSLNTQQISRMLTKLFQRARLEEPGQVDPRGADFTLSLLIAMYDRSGTGYVKFRSAAAALVALSGDTLLAKYRAFFQFYAVPAGKAAWMTRSALRSLLTDLNQIPAIVGESCPLSCVETATHDCFHGMSAKANVKHFLRTIRNNLFQERCRRKEAQRRRTLETVEEQHFPIHKKTFPPAELSASPLPGPENLSFPVDSCVPESPRFKAEDTTAMQKSKNNKKTPEQGKATAQAMSSFEADVLKMHESIKSIHSDSRYMKKQFNKWKNRMQFLHNCQEAKSCKIEAKLRRLSLSHENLQMALQQMKQEVKSMLQSSECPFAQCQNTIPRHPHALLERKMQTQIRPTSRTCADQKCSNPPNSATIMQLLQTPEVPTAVDFMFSDDLLESVSLQSDRPFMGHYKKANENQTCLPKLTENSLSGIMGNTVLTPTAVHILPDEKEVREEMELEQLVMKLQDALSLQTQSELMTSEYEKTSLKSDMKMQISKSFSNSKKQLNTQFSTAAGPHFISIVPSPLALVTAISPICKSCLSVSGHFDIFPQYGPFPSVCV